MLTNKHTTSLIIKAAYSVYKKLGFGFLEKLFERAMLIECRKLGLDIRNQHPTTVYYDNQVIGEYIIDLFVDKDIIVELKSIKKLEKIHFAQTLNYLKVLRLHIALLINFAPDGVEIHRIVN